MIIFQQLITLLGLCTQFLFGVSPEDTTGAGPVVVPYATTTALVLSIIDGDTIDVRLASSTETIRVRYIGIDTPELYKNDTPECWSVEATARNRELVLGKTVELVPGADPYDKYGRVLAYVYTDSVFINNQLIREGHADVLMIPPNVEYAQAFRSLKNAAKVQKLGQWTCST